MERIELTREFRELLLRIPPLDGIAVDSTDGVLTQLEYVVHRIEKGDLVARQGDPCNQLYVLLEGRLRVDIVDAFGNRILIEHIDAPRIFATPHLFGADNTLPATFTALDVGVLFSATRNSAFRLISSEPEILQKFLCITGNCNYCTTKRLHVLSYKGVRERLVIYLLDRLMPGEETVSIVHNNSQLAEYLNVTRPALSKEINKLKREGVLTIDGDRVRISNPGLLRSIVNRANQ